MAGRRGPAGDPIEVVKLKNVAPQVNRALASGRMAAHEIAETVTKDLPVLEREMPEVFTRKISREEFRKMIVDSVAGLKILRQPDELLLNILVDILAKIQDMVIGGVDPTIMDDAGREKLNPAFDAYLKLVDRAVKILSQLGLNPSTRSQIIANAAAAGKDALDATRFGFNPFSRDNPNAIQDRG